MICEQLILNKNIHELCYETVQQDVRGMLKFPQLCKAVVNFFVKHIIGTQNMYPAIFITSKLDQLEKVYNNPNDKHIKRKLLIELFVFLAVCNKPSVQKQGFVIQAKSRSKTKRLTNDNNNETNDDERMLIKELQSSRREGVVIPLVDLLIKTKEDSLWNIALTLANHVSNRKHMIAYVTSLQTLYHSRIQKKELLLEAYRALCSENALSMFYDNSEYSSIIFQCMMKINYIYEEEGEHDKHFDLYKACIYCPMQWLTISEEKPILHISFNEMHMKADESRWIDLNAETENAQRRNLKNVWSKSKECV